jgi:hypothetical protein
MQSSYVLVTLTVASMFFSGYEKFSYFIHNVKMDPKASVEEVIVDAVYNVFCGIKKAYLSGDIRQFFFAPQTFDLRMRCSEFCDDRYDSLAKMKAKLEGCKSLQKEVVMSNDPGINPYRLKLTAFVSNLESKIASAQAREAPIVFWTFGSPGSGKTTLTLDVAASYALACGEAIDPSEIGWIDFQKKFPCEGINPMCKVFVVNDFKDNWVGDNKINPVPMEVSLQCLMDTVPYVPNQAVAEKKGIVYGKLKLVIFTSNFKTFAFDSNVEKLQRRFNEYAAIFNQELMDSNGNRVLYDELDDLQRLKMPEMIKFQQCRAYPDDKKFSFQPSSTSWFSLREFNLYIEDFFRMRIAMNAYNKNKTSDTCACGRSIISHFSNGNFLPYCDKCHKPEDIAPPPALCKVCGNLSHEGVVKAYHKPLDGTVLNDVPSENRQGIVSKKWLNQSIDPILTEAISSVNGRFHNDPRNRFLEETSSTDALVIYSGWIFVIIMLVYHYQKKFYVCITSLIEQVKLANVQLRMYRPMITSFDKDFQDAKIQFERFRSAYKKYGWIIGLVGANLVVWKIVRGLLIKSLEYNSKVVTVNNVDHESLLMKTYSTQSSFPKDTRDRWGMPETYMSRAIIEKMNVSSSQLVPLSKANLVPFKIQSGANEVCQGYLFIITPEYALTSGHYFADDKNNWLMEIKVGGEKVEVFLDRNLIRFVMDGSRRCDVAVVRLTTPIVKANLLDFWIQDLSTVSQFPCFAPFSYGDVIGNAIVHRPRSWTIEGVDYDKGVMLEFINRDCRKGDCGTPVVAEFRGTSCLVGIVSFSHPSTSSLAEYVKQSQLISAIESFGRPFIRSLVFNRKSETVLALSEMSQFRKIQSYYLAADCTVSRPGKFKSSIVPTYCNERIRELRLLKQEYSMPIKSSVVFEGEYLSPLTHTFSHINMPNKYVPKLLMKAATVYFQHLDKNLPKCVLSPLTLEQVFLGDPDQAIDRCNFTSSLGSYSIDDAKTRNDLFDEVIVDDQAKMIFRQNWKFELMEIQRHILNGELECLHTSANIKDEVRPLSKVAMAKLRLFYTVDPFINTLMKMYIAPIRSLLLHHPEISFMFAKINSSSNQWDELAKYLKILLPDWNVMDLDFTNFDVSHFCAIIDEVAFLVYRLAKRLYLEEEASLMCYLLIMMIKCKILKHAGDLALWLKGMPSGCDLTLMINCFINILLMLYAFIYLYYDRFEPEVFFEKVKPATLGDDNISAVHKSIPEFNAVTLKGIYNDLGYRITNASKGDKILPYISWDMAQFLKRGFRFEKDLGVYVAPIDTDSIWKMLSFWNTSKQNNVSFTDRMSAAFDVAQREFFFHGKDSFEYHLLVLKDLALRGDISVPWKSYDFLLQLFKDKKYEMNWI